MLDKYLIEIGLNEKEAAIYLALLEVDNSSVIDLAKKTKIKRSTVYVILESLEKKGLVTETTIGKKTHYQAEPPERLESYIERQKVLLDEKKKRLKDFIPQIKSIQRGSGERPIVKYFEGRDGIISASEEILYNEKGDGLAPIYLIYSRDLLDENFRDEEKFKLRGQRLKQNIKSKVIYTYSKGEIPSDNMGERLRIDEKKYPITCDIAIYKDKIRFSVLGKKLYSIFIKSQDLADTLKSLFNLVNDSSKKN